VSANSFGRFLTMTTFGESHGAGLGVVLDGVPPGLALDLEAVQAALDRRRPGASAVTTARAEADRAEVLSGLYRGLTTGAPLALLFRNHDADSAAYDDLAEVFRPGHADFTYHAKYGLRDPRGGGRSSGRETIARVAAGAVAAQVLAPWRVTVRGWVDQVGDVVARTFDPAAIDANPVRCPDAAAALAMVARIEAARDDGDSLGGRVRVRADHVPVGLGDPVFAKLDAALAGALMSIGGVKAVEIGAGCAVAGRRGSENNDEQDAAGYLSNHAGGVLGGISNGAPLELALAVKPTASIGRPQRAVDVHGAERTLEVGGRHDPCLCPRIVPVAEAMVTFCLADALLAQRALGREPAPGGAP
jgi:chorismate synthase